MIDADASEACSIEALRHDHRRAMRLVGLLVERIDSLRRLEHEDVKIAHDIFRYMVDFVDRDHHAREDRVIDALLARKPQLRPQVEWVSQAHQELGAEGQALLSELAAMRERRGARPGSIVPRLANYAAALASHFESEDRELFSRAAELLTPADWQGVAAGGDDPLFGPEVEQGFEALFETYVGRVREMGAPTPFHAPRAAAVMVESAAALLGGARQAVGAIVSGSKRTVHANIVGASAMAHARSLHEVAAAASAWTSGAVGEAKAAVRQIRDVARETTYSTLEPVECALTAPSRQFASSHRPDRTAPSWQAHLVNLGLRALVKRGAAKFTIEAVRQPRSESRIERMLTALDPDVRVTTVPIGGGHVEIFEVDGVTPERTVLNLPGGAFILRPTKMHRMMAARVARQARARVVLVYYRVAPEHPFPAGLDDCFAAYRYLLDTGSDPKTISLLGDSAGGCLSLSVLLRLRQEGLPLPAAAVVISPVTDLSYGGTSRNDNRWVDPMLVVDERNLLAEVYLVGTPTDDPLVSPLFGDLRDLPPVLMLVGSSETLLDDSLRFAAKARAQGSDCECEVWHEMPHDWLLFGMLPEAKKALNHVNRFIERHTAKPAWFVGGATEAARRKVQGAPRSGARPAYLGRHAA
jgi:acetyl esterase/lipase/hemerythrin-like domain-containing protein